MLTILAIGWLMLRKYARIMKIKRYANTNEYQYKYQNHHNTTTLAHVWRWSLGSTWGRHARRWWWAPGQGKVALARVGWQLSSEGGLQD